MLAVHSISPPPSAPLYAAVTTTTTIAFSTTVCSWKKVKSWIDFHYYYYKGKLVTSFTIMLLTLYLDEKEFAIERL
ncbi:hypothetical protein L2E82_05931 [Cichorium intybus]|uniref:Uncharacterized protein n=1 Tax=Cichorium intybus TaxID=13427 RepID=A0ACB9H944_CICIN|nr:hypothetical protein L2E82_05931 [Cichorium intybus]